MRRSYLERISAQAVLLVCLAAVCTGARADVTAYASSTSSGSDPSLVLDDKGVVTSWRTDGTKLPQWIALDLAEPMKVNRLRWKRTPQGAFPRDYDVEVCNSDQAHDGGGTWLTVASVKGNTNEYVNEVSFPSRETRHIRLKVNSVRGDPGQGLSISLIEVGFAGPISTPRDIEARAGEQSIRVSWHAVGDDSERDVVGYDVFRSDNVEDGYFLLNMTAPVEGKTYEDRNILPRRTYFYRIAPVCTGGWTGGMSRPVKVVAPEFEFVRGARRTGVSDRSIGRFGEIDYMRERTYTEGLLSWMLFIARNRQPYFCFPTLRTPEHIFREPSEIDCRYITNPLCFGTVRPIGQRESPLGVRQLWKSWVGRVLEFDYGDVKMLLYTSLVSPAVTVEMTGDCQNVRLFDEMPTFGVHTPEYVAFRTGGGVATGAFTRTRVIKPHMSAPWMLMWFKGKKGWEEYDVPWLVVFQHRPVTIMRTVRSIDVVFEGECGRITLMPLLGIKKMHDHGDWSRNVPGTIVQLCDRWAASTRTIPMDCSEEYSVGYERGVVTIRQTYAFMHSTDEWGSQTVGVSPVPPVVGLARAYGFDVQFGEGISSLGYLSPFGPLYGRLDEGVVEWTIPAPLDYLSNPDWPASSAVRDETMARAAAALFPGERFTWLGDRPMRVGLDRCRQEGRGRGSGVFAEIEPSYGFLQLMKRTTKSEFLRAARGLLEPGAFSARYMALCRDGDAGRRAYTDGWRAGGQGAGEGSALEAARILRGIYLYCSCTGNWELVRQHWNSITYYLQPMEVSSDWAMQGPSRLAVTGIPRHGSGFQLGLSECLEIYDGLTAYARMAKAAGDTPECEKAVYLAAKLQVLIYFYFKYQDYAASFPPWPAEDETQPDARRSVVEFVSGAVGPSSWAVSGRERLIGRAPSAELARFYGDWLRDDIERHLSTVVRDRSLYAREEDFHNGMSTGNFLLRWLLLDDPPSELWKLTTDMWPGGVRDDVSCYAAVALSAPLTGPPAQPRQSQAESVPAADDEITYSRSVALAVRLVDAEEIWSIGEADGSGDELSIRSSDLPLPLVISFVPGEDDPKKSWPSFHPRGTKYILSFDLKQGGADTYYLVVGLAQLPSDYPLIYRVTVNGGERFVRCPESVPGMPRPVQIAFPVDAKELKETDNLIALEVGDGCRGVAYDYLELVAQP